jgi:hypothetical protein
MNLLAEAAEVGMVEVPQVVMETTVAVAVDHPMHGLQHQVCIHITRHPHTNRAHHTILQAYLQSRVSIAAMVSLK